MKTTEFNEKIQKLTDRLLDVPYSTLPISSYNKAYIQRMMPAINYYLKIFGMCLQKGIKESGMTPEELTLVDFGGGSGFLSMLAKVFGVGKVIYVDHNPLSVQTATTLKEHIGIGADVILEGSSDELYRWCRKNQLKPEVLIATDLIEHVYDLKSFFGELLEINSSMKMYFTTASTPFNPYVKWKLRKIMVSCESGQGETPNYYTKRFDYIRHHFPELTEAEAKDWAICCRGLTFKDIHMSIPTGLKPCPSDRWNTCDPENGNWTQRILPIRKYYKILTPYDYKVKVSKGYYNEQRSSSLMATISRLLNKLIHLTGSFGYIAAPFIVLSCVPYSSSRSNSSNPLRT